MSRVPLSGFTLLELMVGLAITAILFAVGVPGLGGYLAEQRVHDRADALLRTLQVARSEAIKRGERVDVCPGPGGSCAAVATPWEGGWRVVADATRSASAAIATEHAATSGITIRGNRPLADYVSYTAAGHARRFDGALQMGTFTVCSPGQRVRKVILASSGRARLETAAEMCP
ncbi:MAG TPA: GspH/FimT family pseudopilin [Casimicrobiaceae bacterium]|jgi:type IV fimbrial biogenesis protein FimT|nr:GspH/FimT family pseudopilin [Casimicrobiaceae bacterium]